MDKTRSLVTLVVRAAPGAVYPSHKHHGPEECFVISGSLFVEGRVLRPGDFHYAEGNSDHGELWTDDGKRLGVLARLRNLLPGRYAFGLTGRDATGRVLDPGVYVLRLRAQPVDGGDGQAPSTAEAVFRILR